MSDSGSFSLKFECDDSNFNNSINNYQLEEEQCDNSQTYSSTPIKTTDGKQISVYLSMGNKLLFSSGKYFYIEQTVEHTDYQKEFKGIVAICHTCGTKIKGSLKVSSNFLCHLKSKHPDVYQDFNRQKSKSDYTVTSTKHCKRNSNNRISPYPASNTVVNKTMEKQEQFHYKLIQFLIATNQTFDVVQNPSFLELFRFTDIPIEIGPVNYYKKLVSDACEYKRMELSQIFNALPYICTTFDSWTYNKSTYIAISAHWIDEQLQRQSALLCCKKMKNPGDFDQLYNTVLTQYRITPSSIIVSTTMNLQTYPEDFCELDFDKEVLQETLHQLGDPENSLMVLDCSDMLQQYKFLELDIVGLNMIWCRNFLREREDCDWALHKVAMEKCCCIWRESQTKERTEAITSLIGESLMKPHPYSMMSLYTAIRQLMSYKEKLEDICGCLNTPSLSSQEVEYLQEFTCLFEPLALAFDFLDVPQNHYYGCLLPTLVTLKWKLTRLHNSKKLKYLSVGLKRIKTELQINFNSYYNLDESEADVILAALTYPPVKTRFLSGLKDNANCLKIQPRNMLLKHAKEYHQIDDNLPNQFSDTENKAAINHEVNGFFDFGDTIDSADEESSTPQSLKLEIDAYLSDPDISLLSLRKYPTVLRMFCRYNTCIPSPSSVVRIFPIREILRKSLNTPCDEEEFENLYFYSHYYGNNENV
ncbi:uncharacterized protein isoform X2 [Musca autumnalis]|uniref:uncharacterized protein isoform X2 n=1 Tax=Musca autumnalis TaxID=221902 RepID=UPI003CE6AC7C